MATIVNNDQNIQSIPSQDIDLKYLLDAYKKLIKIEFACHHIGTIQSFNSTDQTSSVTINYQKTILTTNDIGTSTVTSANYVTIVGCPTMCLGGGNSCLTFPISKGDECLLLFNDRDFDNWFAGSSSSPPATPRLHSLTDCLVLVGVRSLPNIIPNYNGSATELRTKDGNGKVSVATDGTTTVSCFGTTTVVVADGSVTVSTVDTSLTLTESDLSASLSGGTVALTLSSSGTLSITNATGEFVSLLNTLFTDIQSGTILGLPLVMPTFATDLAKFQTFV